MSKGEYFGEGVDYKHPNELPINSNPLGREVDSLEDFEHLEHFTPVQSQTVRGSDNKLLSDQIDIEQKHPSTTALGLSSSPNTAAPPPIAAVSNPIEMDSNLLVDLDNDSLALGVNDDKMDQFLDNFAAIPSPMLPTKLSPSNEEKQDLIKAAVEDFVAAERTTVSDTFYNAKKDDTVEAKAKEEIPIQLDQAKSNVWSDSAKSTESLPPVKNEDVKKSNIVREAKEDTKKQKESEIVETTQPTSSASKPKPPITEAEAMFKKIGLDAWFSPERLNPEVESLIYWRDPKKSGPVFGGVLVVLLSLTCFSLITVIAYLSLLTLSVTLAFRIYKNIIQAIQKTGDGHPFKEYLEKDVSLPQEKVKEVIEISVAHLNAAVMELRRLFLVEDLVDSIKFAGFLWCLTYVGSWFNGMTLVILAWVSLFTLPKVYETNKVQIDANLDIVRTKLAEITSKVKAAIPIGKKSEEKKEQ